jgi:hypothetical protein
VVLDNGNSYAVTQGAEVSGYAPSSGGGEAFTSFGFFTARADVENSAQNEGQPFRLVDMTTGEQAPANTTELVRAAWVPASLPGLQRSAKVLVSYSEPGGTYTFHTSGGTLQGVSASWENAVDPVSANIYEGWMVSCPVQAGTAFWVTRDSDGAMSPRMTMPLNNQVVDWSAAFPPVQNLQTFWFQIGGDRAGHTLSIHHMNGTAMPLYQPLWTTPGANYLTTWDGDGLQTDYHYENFEAKVDVSQTGWTLFDETTGEELGQTTAVFESWQVWRPEPPAGLMSIAMSSSRRGHDLWLRQAADGLLFPLSPAAGYETPANDRTASNTRSFNGTGATLQNSFSYFPAEAQYDAAQGFSIVDQTTGEEIPFPAGTPSANLSQWYLAASPLTVNVSVTRWTHELWLRQPNGWQVRLKNQTLQGEWVGGVSFTSYGYFDAAASCHPGVDWWIYDATTGEVSAVSPADLIGWTDDTDSDADTLPGWQEFILGTDPHNPDTDGDGLSDAWELAHGMNPLDATDADRDSDGDGLTNRQEKANGTDPHNASTGGSGIPDGWAVTNGLNPLDAGLASGDPTGGGMTNYWKYLLGLNPNSTDTDGNGIADVDEDTDGDGIPNGWEIAYGLDPLNSDDAGQDWDGDGLTNDWEYRLGLNPWSPGTYGYPDGDADFDGDGILNKWEIAHGMNPADAIDAGLDPFGRGFSNLDGYLAGIGAKDLLSKLPLAEDLMVFCDGLNPIRIEFKATGGDPSKTTFEVAGLDFHTLGKVESGSSGVGYWPPIDLIREDDFQYVARQGNYTSLPATVRIRLEGVVSVSASVPGKALYVPASVSSNENMQRRFGVLQKDDDHDNHPAFAGTAQFPDHADAGIGPDDDDVVMVELAFNPADLADWYDTLTITFPQNVHVYTEPLGGPWSTPTQLVRFPDHIRNLPPIEINDLANHPSNYPPYLHCFLPLAGGGKMKVYLVGTSENGGKVTAKATGPNPQKVKKDDWRGLSVGFAPRKWDGTTPSPENRWIGFDPPIEDDRPSTTGGKDDTKNGPWWASIVTKNSDGTRPTNQKLRMKVHALPPGCGIGLAYKSDQDPLFTRLAASVGKPDANGWCDLVLQATAQGSGATEPLTGTLYPTVLGPGDKVRTLLEVPLNVVMFPRVKVSVGIYFLDDPDSVADDFPVFIPPTRPVTPEAIIASLNKAYTAAGITFEPLGSEAYPVGSKLGLKYDGNKDGRLSFLDKDGKLSTPAERGEVDLVYALELGSIEPRKIPALINIMIVKDFVYTQSTNGICPIWNESRDTLMHKFVFVAWGGALGGPAARSSGEIERTSVHEIGHALRISTRNGYGVDPAAHLGDGHDGGPFPKDVVAGLNDIRGIMSVDSPLRTLWTRHEDWEPAWRTTFNFFR